MWAKPRIILHCAPAFPRIPRIPRIPTPRLAQTRRPYHRAGDHGLPSHEPGHGGSAMIRPDRVFLLESGQTQLVDRAQAALGCWIRSTTTTGAPTRRAYALKPSTFSALRHRDSDLGQEQPIEGMMTMARTTPRSTKRAKPPSDHPSSTSSDSCQKLPSVRFLAFDGRLLPTLHITAPSRRYHHLYTSKNLKISTSCRGADYTNQHHQAR